jgi:hypothetical protein
MAELKVEIGNLTRLLEQGAAGEARLAVQGCRKVALGVEKWHWSLDWVPMEVE